ncbi:MAG: methyltransferase type 11 [Ilumatobacter coccineus]|uniref:Methyltransferase type 11 n=1 Tax=Ilumatobacter coccineus TaxID=467094 RepID=A0A2G6KFD1_9ACTN|nr:MAG: methyltransferase type 11 [Ilumatobacter coccineus]
MNDANVAGNTYDKYGSTNPIERRLMSGFFTAFDRMLDGLTPRHILEVGAGEGHITSLLIERFPDAEVSGIDLPDDDLAAIWAEAKLPITFGDVTALDYDDHSIDLIIGMEMLEHVTDPQRALAEIARVAADTVIVSVPREPIWRIGNLARGHYLGALGNTPGHLNHWSARGFTRFVASELTVVDTARPLPWTMVKAISTTSV